MAILPLSRITYAATLANIKTFCAEPSSALSLFATFWPQFLPQCSQKKLEDAVWEKLSFTELYDAIRNTNANFSLNPEEIQTFIGKNWIDIARASIYLIATLHALKILKILDESKLADLNIAAGALGLLRVSVKTSILVRNPDKEDDLQRVLGAFAIGITLYFATRTLWKGMAHYETLRSYIPADAAQWFSEEIADNLFRFSALLGFVDHFYRGYKTPTQAGGAPPPHSFISYYLSGIKAKGIVELALLILSYVSPDKKSLFGGAVDLKQASKHLEDLRQQLFLPLFVSATASFLDGIRQRKGLQWNTLLDLSAPLKELGSAGKWLVVGPMSAFKDWKDTFSNMKNISSVVNTSVGIHKQVRWAMREDALLTLIGFVFLSAIILQAAIMGYNVIELAKRQKWRDFTDKHLQQTRVIMTVAGLIFCAADYWKKTSPKE